MNPNTDKYEKENRNALSVSVATDPGDQQILPGHLVLAVTPLLIPGLGGVSGTPLLSELMHVGAL